MHVSFMCIIIIIIIKTLLLSLLSLLAALLLFKMDGYTGIRHRFIFHSSH